MKPTLAKSGSAVVLNLMNVPQLKKAMVEVKLRGAVVRSAIEELEEFGASVPSELEQEVVLLRQQKRHIKNILHYKINNIPLPEKYLPHYPTE